MSALVGYILLFIVVGVGFILIHLLLGMLIRPRKPHAEKQTIYECGEPTIGSSWIQFDLRFYVVALLFVIFDVEVAFFFPWAVVFGKANQLGSEHIPAAQRAEVYRELVPAHAENKASVEAAAKALTANSAELQQQIEQLQAESKAAKDKLPSEKAEALHQLQIAASTQKNVAPAARQLALLAFVDILFFFGVLLVGFAYLWKRGDLDWVRSLASERAAAGRTTDRTAVRMELDMAGAGKA